MCVVSTECDRKGHDVVTEAFVSWCVTS